MHEQGLDTGTKSYGEDGDPEGIARARLTRMVKNSIGGRELDDHARACVELMVKAGHGRGDIDTTPVLRLPWCNQGCKGQHGDLDGNLPKLDFTVSGRNVQDPSGSDGKGQPITDELAQGMETSQGAICPSPQGETSRRTREWRRCSVLALVSRGPS